MLYHIMNVDPDETAEVVHIFEAETVEGAAEEFDRFFRDQTDMVPEDRAWHELYRVEKIDMEGLARRRISTN